MSVPDLIGPDDGGAGADGQKASAGGLPSLSDLGVHCRARIHAEAEHGEPISESLIKIDSTPTFNEHAPEGDESPDHAAPPALTAEISRFERCGSDCLAADLVGDCWDASKCSQDDVSEPGHHTVRRHDEASDANRGFENFVVLSTPLEFVAIQKRIVGASFDHGGKLPAEIGSVSKGTGDALTSERRHDMGRIADEQDTTDSPAFRATDVERVGPVPLNLDVIRSDAAGGQQPPDALR